MKHGWENNGEPNAEGSFVAFVDMEDGSGIQRFEGKSHQEVADKLLQAQSNATAKIQDLRRNVTPDPARPRTEVKPRALTADEKFITTQEITDPAKVESAVARVVEARLGMPLDRLSERVKKDEEESEADFVRRQGVEFANENPDYYSCPYNAELIANYCLNNRMAFTKKNYGLAFEALRKVGLVQLRPEANPEEVDPAQPGGLPANSAVRTRPRVAAATGIRSGDSTGTPELRRPVAPKYTLEQIEAMPADEYERRLKSEAGFAELVDKLAASA